MQKLCVLKLVVSSPAMCNTLENSVPKHCLVRGNFCDDLYSHILQGMRGEPSLGTYGDLYIPGIDEILMEGISFRLLDVNSDMGGRGLVVQCNILKGIGE